MVLGCKKCLVLGLEVILPLAAVALTCVYSLNSFVAHLKKMVL